MEKNKEKLHIRHCILHLYHTGVNAAEASRIIKKVYENSAVSENMCRRWFHKFQTGDFDVNDKKREGRPRNVMDQELEKLYEENPNLTTFQLGRKLGVSSCTVSRRLNALGFDLGKKKKRKLDDVAKEDEGD
uniref:Putative histone-lysine n-methyltransferase setmar n=1 Tax=Nyssomyia neivai TaxID=330878 RepID=A0A1L8DWG7_9DIPT